MPTPDLPVMYRYLDLVLCALADEPQPDSQFEYDQFEYSGDNTTYDGFRLVWRENAAWPEGVGVTWDERWGWHFIEDGIEPDSLLGTDEVVPAPDVVAAAIAELLATGNSYKPAPSDVARWSEGDALIASLQYG